MDQDDKVNLQLDNKELLTLAYIMIEHTSMYFNEFMRAATENKKLHDILCPINADLNKVRIALQEAVEKV